MEINWDLGPFIAPCLTIKFVKTADSAICGSVGRCGAARVCEEHPIVRLLRGLPAPTVGAGSPQVSDRPVCVSAFRGVPGDADCVGKGEDRDTSCIITPNMID